MIEQSRQRILAGLLLGVVEELQILNCRTSLGGKGQDNLLIQFAEVGHDTLCGHFIREKQPAEKLALAPYRHSEE